MMSNPLLHHCFHHVMTSRAVTSPSAPPQSWAPRLRLPAALLCRFRHVTTTIPLFPCHPSSPMMRQQYLPLLTFVTSQQRATLPWQPLPISLTRPLLPYTRRQLVRAAKAVVEVWVGGFGRVWAQPGAGEYTPIPFATGFCHPREGCGLQWVGVRVGFPHAQKTPLVLVCDVTPMP